MSEHNRACIIRHKDGDDGCNAVNQGEQVSTGTSRAVHGKGGKPIDTPFSFARACSH